jgi:hypothetical protein
MSVYKIVVIRDDGCKEVAAESTHSDLDRIFAEVVATYEGRDDVKLELREYHWGEKGISVRRKWPDSSKTKDTVESALKNTAKKIVTVLEKDLNGRSGLSWDTVDDEIQEEIRTTWICLVLDVLENAY